MDNNLIKDKKKKPNLEVQHKEAEEDKTKKEIEEYKNKYLRALADYQNLEKRIIDQRDEQRKNIIQELVVKLLPLLDHMEKAEIFSKDEGLVLAKSQFTKVIKDFGIKEIDVLGKEFNPHQAEVIDIVKGEKDNLVTEVLRKGYCYEDRILRVAQVKVSKKGS